MKPLISIVVPVYKAEPYLRQCADSLINQTYKELDIILVDDGSPDNSGNICDEYAAADSRIRVMHTDNGGQARARNIGTAAARGEYITYVDSDDFIDPRMIEALYSLIEQSGAELSVCDIFEMPDGDAYTPPSGIDTDAPPTMLSSHEAVRAMLYQKMFDSSPCAKMYRTENCLRSPFPEGHIFEDLATVYKFLLGADNTIYSPMPLYIYRIRQNSTMRTAFNPAVLYEVTAADEICEYARLNAPELLPAANARRFSAYAQVLRWLPADNLTPELEEVRDRLWSFMRSYRMRMLTDSSARFKNRAAALLTLGGRRLFCRIRF